MPTQPSGGMLHTLPESTGLLSPQVLAAVPPSWGIDAAAPIQPRMYSFHDSSTMEVPGSGTLRALAGGPLLAQRWLPARCVLGGVEVCCAVGAGVLQVYCRFAVSYSRCSSRCSRWPAA